MNNTSRFSDDGIENHSVLDNVTRNVEHFLLQDRNFPSLMHQLKLKNEDTNRVSGLAETDYLMPPETLQQIQHISLVKRVALPAGLTDQLTKLDATFSMGLLPEIGRAWMVVDTVIYLWTYQDCADLAYFDCLGEVIVAVGLVKPKAGIFQSHIRYLLVLATAIEVVILGVRFSQPPGCSSEFAEMHLLPEPLYSLPTDNVSLTSIVGTDIGRIFASGKDGCLYEITYQRPDSIWFGKPCKKINHSTGILSYVTPLFITYAFGEEDSLIKIALDHSRHILYTLSEKGVISVWDLDDNGMGLRKVCSMGEAMIHRQATRLTESVDQNYYKNIVSLHVVESYECSIIHLVAVTASGVRMYFSTFTSDTMLSGITTSRPNNLVMVHVRVPPGFSCNTRARGPRTVRLSHSGRGLCLFTHNVSDAQDDVWVLSPQLLASRSPLSEMFSVLSVDGRTWDVREEGSGVPHFPSEPGAPTPPALVTQHLEQPRRIIMISYQGVHILKFPRPVDQLRDLLEMNNGPESQAIRAFFSLLGPNEACATALLLACSTNATDDQIRKWATRAFFLYGGDPGYHVPNPEVGPSTFHSPQTHIPSHASFHPMSMSTPQQQQLILSPQQQPFSPQPQHNTSQQQQHYTPQQQMILQPQYTIPQQGHHTPVDFMAGGVPSNDSRLMGQQVQPPSLGPTLRFSAKHNALYMYYSRLLYPLWYTKVVETHKAKNDKELTGSSVGVEDLSWLIDRLSAFLKFLDENSVQVSPIIQENMNLAAWAQRASLLRSGAASDRQQQQSDVNSQMAEKQSIIGLQNLIRHTKQVLGLWKVLCEHQFHSLVDTLTRDTHNHLKTLMFRDLIISGKDTCCSLINALISRYITDYTAVDCVTSRLRVVCPSLFQEQDAVCAKANEILAAARSTTDAAEKQKHLDNALQLCKQVAQQLNLSSVCEQLKAARCYSGLVDLCSVAATQRDQSNMAVHFYRAGQPNDDKTGMKAFNSRQECYKVVTTLMGELLTNINLADQDRQASTEAAKDLEEVVRLSFRCDDELLHIAIFSWLLDHKMDTMLLQIPSPYLENYLQGVATSGRGCVLRAMELLWKHYQQKQKYASAAQVLSKLAERHGTDINLCQRLEYLSRAILSVSSSNEPDCTPHGKFYYDLQEKMDVAKVQMKILTSINPEVNKSTETQLAASKLNADLYSIAELYNEFAHPLNLYECQLAIIHCSSYQDQNLINALWTNLIDSEFSAVDHLPLLEDKINALSRTLVRLGNDYGSPEKYFPVDFLAEYLEKCSIGNGLHEIERHWVAEAFLQIGISVIVLHKAYHSLYKSKETFWQDSDHKLHPLYVILYLLKYVIAHPRRLPTAARRKFMASCLNDVADYRLDLQAQSALRQEVVPLLYEFEEIKDRLERLSHT